jgi:hypothetical protein
MNEFSRFKNEKKLSSEFKEQVKQQRLEIEKNITEKY